MGKQSPQPIGRGLFDLAVKFGYVAAEACGPIMRASAMAGTMTLAGLAEELSFSND